MACENKLDALHKNVILFLFSFIAIKFVLNVYGLWILNYFEFLRVFNKPFLLERNCCKRYIVSLRVYKSFDFSLVVFNVCSRCMICLSWIIKNLLLIYPNHFKLNKHVVHFKIRCWWGSCCFMFDVFKWLITWDVLLTLCNLMCCCLSTRNSN